VGLLDNLTQNAYGIYLVHYVFVTWLQLWLFGADLSAVVEATLVFAGMLLLSWSLIAALRHVAAVARVL
jgi:hypothetical protein